MQLPDLRNNIMKRPPNKHAKLRCFPESSTSVWHTHFPSFYNAKTVEQNKELLSILILVNGNHINVLGKFFLGEGELAAAN